MIDFSFLDYNFLYCFSQSFFMLLFFEIVNCKQRIQNYLYLKYIIFFKEQLIIDYYMERKTTHLLVTLSSSKKRHSSLPYNLKRAKKCIIASLSNIQLQHILTFLTLTDLIRMHEAMLKNPKTEEGARTIIKFVATEQRIYSTIELKHFLQYYILRKRKLYKWWNANKQQQRNDMQRISWDVQRTNVWFCRSKQQIRNMRGFLTRVLNRLCGSSSQFGYVQGFHCVIKAMFQARLNENQSWLLGSYFLKEMKLGSYYENKQEKIRQICYVLDVYVYNNLPQIHYFLKKRELTAQCYAIGWYLTLFSQGLPTSLLSKLWILFVIKGWKVIIKFSVALLCVFQKEILQKQESQLPEFLSNLHQKLIFKKQKMLWQLYSSIKVTNRMISYLAKNMRELEYDRQISILELKEMRDGNPLRQRLSTVQSTSFPSYFSVGVCCEKVQASYSFPYCNDY